MLRLFHIIYQIQKARHPAFPFWALLSSWMSIKWNGLKYKYNNSEFRISLFGKPWTGIDSESMNFLFNEIFLEKDYQINEIPQNATIFDCGSNIGTSILFFKKICPSAQIIGFEANPRVFDLLQSNITAQQLENVKIYPVALYDRETELPFYVGKKESNMVGSLLDRRGGEEEIRVPTQKLSTFLEKFEKVDIVKIDVEGAEWNILSDLISSQTFEKVNNYLIEYHLNLEGEAGKFSQFLKEFEDRGYRYSIKANYYSAGEFQDLLIHFKKSK